MELRLFVPAFVAFLCLSGCDRDKSVSPGDLRPAPVGAPLSSEQERRVRALHATFAEVDSSPVEKWIEDFRRDRHPDREIAVYEDIATAYRAFSTRRTLSTDEKSDAYSLLLSRSMMSDDQALASVKLKALSSDEARDVLRGYPSAPSPIRVEER